jgi:diaminopimelate dehydrogenase
VAHSLCSELHDPGGGSRRYVYVELARGTDLERVRQQIEADPLFADEPTQVLPVADLAALEEENRGVLIERLEEGSAGPHASLILEARLDPAAFTAGLMLDAARSLAPHARGAWRYTPFGLMPWNGAVVSARINRALD